MCIKEVIEFFQQYLEEKCVNNSLLLQDAGMPLQQYLVCRCNISCYGHSLCYIIDRFYPGIIVVFESFFFPSLLSHFEPMFRLNKNQPRFCLWQNTCAVLSLLVKLMSIFWSFYATRFKRCFLSIQHVKIIVLVSS